MNKSNFSIWNKVCAAFSFVVSAITYLLTIEPSASFWDCGEFIASSYKLEVGHPPGNPVFQLVARFFTLFGDSSHAAVLVNAMSALCSAATILLLYLTVVWLAKRMVKPESNGEYSLAQAIVILSGGVVGALAYCFSDTFWFSAVEGEVYAMSSLFTAFVFWAMTKWYDTADNPHANKWIVLIAFLMGLSIGVHLLNLLAVPALVFIFYYRRREDKPFTFKELFKIFLVGVVILALILYVIIPWLPKLAAYFDLFFVNVLGLPFNTGAAFFMVVVLGLCFWGLFRSLAKEKVVLNTALLCLTTIIVGFSVFSIDIIRSCAKTPTNENQPDNAFSLVRYLSREQYGKSPLIYGQYFDAPYDLKTDKYWTPVDGKYLKANGPLDAKYKKEGKMLFPRMWTADSEGSYEQFYRGYTHGKGKRVPGAKARKPSQAANLYYFLDFQCGWMYWRYFMWNFVGRQNDFHGPAANMKYGNWESGIGFIDRLHIGDMSTAPDLLAENKGKNHYFFLPLLLGLLGLCFQYSKDKRGCWLTFLMFFMTGLAIVIYLNQPPYQVRERDYAYAGSFYFFSAWIGLGVIALASVISDALKGNKKLGAAIAASALSLCIPVLMGAQNWDDHDRSGRKTAVEVASNYLESVGPDGLLITHGDNDTFPLWYAQEVEGIRPDVRVCNTSLLGTDWYIDQMKWASNSSSALPLTVPASQYLYGTNEYVPILSGSDQIQSMTVSEAMAVFKDRKMKVGMSGGRKSDYFPTHTLILPVNKINAVKSGIVPARLASIVPDNIVLTIPESKNYLTKPELFMLDLLSNYEWDRPINLLNMGGDINIGLKEYLSYCGYSYKFVPFKSQSSTYNPKVCDVEELHTLMTEKFKWDALSSDNYHIDYQNLYTFLGVCSVRQIFVVCAQTFLAAGHRDWAEEMILKCLDVMHRYPLETSIIGLNSNDYMVCRVIDLCYKLGLVEQAHGLIGDFVTELYSTTVFNVNYYQYYKDDFEACGGYIYHLAEICESNGEPELGEEIRKGLETILSSTTENS